jgi:hypothetical protein
MTFLPESRPPAHNLLMFIIMFSLCIIGSIGIFVFAVGMETGDKIVESMMTSLIEHAAYVIGLFVLFNLLILGMYWKRKGTKS